MSESSKYDPMQGDCGVTYHKKNYSFNVKDIVDYANDNYEAKEIDLDSVYDLGLFPVKDKMIEVDTSKYSTYVIDGKKYRGDELTDEQIEEFSKENTGHAMDADLKYPIVCVSDGNKIIGVLDGNHRIAKSKILDKDKILAYIIPGEDLEDISDTLNECATFQLPMFEQFNG